MPGQVVSLGLSILTLVKGSSFTSNEGSIWENQNGGCLLKCFQLYALLTPDLYLNNQSPPNEATTTTRNLLRLPPSPSPSPSAPDLITKLIKCWSSLVICHLHLVVIVGHIARSGPRCLFLSLVGFTRRYRYLGLICIWIFVFSFQFLLLPTPNAITITKHQQPKRKTKQIEKAAAPAQLISNQSDETKDLGRNLLCLSLTSPSHLSLYNGAGLLIWRKEIELCFGLITDSAQQLSYNFIPFRHGFIRSS